jgi:hypothetical protein
VVRAVNLDSTDAAVSTTADEQGGFHVKVVLMEGNELRLQAMVGAARSAPADFTFANMMFSPSPRDACLGFTPGLELVFAAPGTRALVVRNDCTETLTVSEPRFRLGLPDFQVQTALPVDVAAGSSASIVVAEPAAAMGEREDVLFLTLTLGATARRYAVTVFAP